jgi:hypothetical protein
MSATDVGAVFFSKFVQFMSRVVALRVILVMSSALVALRLERTLSRNF